MKNSELTERQIFFAICFSVVCSLFFWTTACSPTPNTNQAQENGNIKKVVETTQRVTFLAVGDIMISRGVENAIMRADDPRLPFSKMKDVFSSTDFNFANLESPISGNDKIIGKGLVFNMKTRNIVGLRENNFKILNLANNHAMDQGTKGISQTKDFLTQNDLYFMGAGENLDEAWKPATITVKGVKIGFVGASYASYNDGGVKPNDYVARMEDTARLKRAIETLKAENTDFIVATMHAGIEYTRKPNQTQIDFAHNAIDFGADIVIGGHPHWAQIFEKYKDKYVFYSLGNFIFDQSWSRETMQGLALKITLENKKSEISKTRVEQIELMPVIIENKSTPRLANQAEARQILKNIGADGNIIK